MSLVFKVHNSLPLALGYILTKKSALWIWHQGFTTIYLFASKKKKKKEALYRTANDSRTKKNNKTNK